MFALPSVLLIASILVVLTYLVVGWVFWKGVRRHLLANGDLITVSQEQAGMFAALLPKFTVIVLWPLFAALGLLAAMARIIHRPAVPNV